MTEISFVLGLIVGLCLYPAVQRLYRWYQQRMFKPKLLQRYQPKSK